jgi:pyrroline-5-carboxylate reductase
MTTTYRFDGRLAVIGGGKMGEAIVSGLIDGGVLDSGQMVIAEPVSSRRDELAARYTVRVVDSGSEAVRGSDVVVLAVKPQNIDDVVRDMAPDVRSSVVVSIAAGISCARIESLLAEDTAVVRVMPNTPVMVREGMAVVSGGVAASKDQVDLVASLFGAIGRAVVIDERYQDAATAISGSGPAYFALVIDALARAGVAQGLPREVAQELAVQTMRGTAGMLQETGMHPEALIDGVSSPGGTTIAAVNVLEDHGVRAAFAQAVAAAVGRSKELGSAR